MTAGLQAGQERQRLCDLRDRLQVGRPQPERRADRRVEPAGPLRRDGQAGGRAQLRGRAEDRAVPRRRPRTSPSTTPRSRTSRRRSPTAASGVIRGYLANAEKVRVRGAEFDGSARVNAQSLALRRGRLHRRQVRLVPGRAAAARGHRRAAVQGHLRARSCPASRSGRSRSAASTAIAARSLGRPGSSSARSTPATARRSRRAPPTRGTWSSTATPCSTPGSASGRRTAGRSRSGRATC